MAKDSIDLLKDLINNKISDGSKRQSVFVNDNAVRRKNAILLFYTTDDNSIMALGKFTQAGYYSNGVQVVCRHQDYNKARDVAYNALQYISNNRKAYQGVYFLPDGGTAITYTGLDIDTGGYTWSFEIKLKGGK